MTSQKTKFFGYDRKQKWTSIVITILIEVTRAQVPIPMYPSILSVPAPLPAPMPMAVPMQMPPLLIQLPSDLGSNWMRTTTTTTTTTTTESIAIAVPFHLPMPVQIAIPSYLSPQACASKTRPPGCPPCPPCLCTPSCTPAFFSYCSPCHQKCRCRNGGDAPKPQPPKPPVPILGPSYALPVPVPAPVPIPPPLYVVPIPPQPLRMRRPTSESDSCESSYSSSDDECRRRRFNRNRKKKRKLNRKRRLRNMRRSFLSSKERSDNELVEPVLSYVSRNGDVKFKTRIRNDEAVQLLEQNGANDPKRTASVQIVTGGDANKNSELMIMSDAEEFINDINHRTVVLRNGRSQQMLQTGKKQLIFKPPDDRKISNLSISFRVE